MALVDSSAWIEAGRRDGRRDVKVALEGLLEAFEAAWCGVVKLEALGGGHARGDGASWNCYFSTIPCKRTNEAAMESAKVLSWKLRGAGVTVQASDILIAALAIESGARVYSCDSDFEAMAKIIPLQLYSPEDGGSYSEG